LISEISIGKGLLAHFEGERFGSETHLNQDGTFIWALREEEGGVFLAYFW
jgi:hypothetical protein